MSYDPCRCCGGCKISRRGFLAGAGAAPVLAAAPRPADPNRQLPIHTPLKVQPVLTCQVPVRARQRSWRPWGAIQTEADVAAEQERIRKELAALHPGFALEMLPLETARTEEQAARVAQGNHHVTLIYAAGGSVKTLEAAARLDKHTLLFVRHRSGPVYLWYEIAHPRFLRKTVDEYGQPGMDSEDVVVDSHAEVLWRLRALYGLQSATGKRIVAVGGAAGWGAAGRKAGDLARDIWKMDIRPVPYAELGARIRRAAASQTLVRKCHDEAAKYLKQKGVTLQTAREFVGNAFILTEVFRDLLDEAQTDAITINQCMGTIMPIAETTACLPLSLLNDDGYMAFCESDFVVIPSGVLLHYVSGKPVFLNDPTYPHDGIVTMAHCTAPRKMSGDSYDPVRILTHFESDYGASPKVEMRKGQRVTVLDPDFGGRNWVGFQAEVVDNPFLPICRSQVDVEIKGDCQALAREMKGFHWMVSYGEYLKETAYALKKGGIRLQSV